MPHGIQMCIHKDMYMPLCHGPQSELGIALFDDSIISHSDISQSDVIHVLCLVWYGMV